MKNWFLDYRIPLLLLLICCGGCEKQVLDKNPVDKYSETTLWTDIGLADAYLLNTYDRSRYEFTDPQTDYLTDNAFFLHGQENYIAYVQGDLTADNPFPLQRGYPWWSDFFANIQAINEFLANIDDVPNAYSEDERESIQERANLLKGQALFLRAFSYSRLAFNYGGVPLSKDPFELGTDFSSLNRASFEETINFISADLDAAASLLGGKGDMELGRATKGAALALKSRVLLFAASDLTADGTAENKYVGYESPDRTALWTAAKNAAKAVMDLGTYELADFGAPDQEAVAQNYYDFFRQRDLSNNEIIWGKMFLNGDGVQNRMNNWNSPNGHGGFTGAEPIQDLVDNYEMEDGSNFFDHYEIDADGYYRNISSTFPDDNIYHNRDPRFYGSILADSSVWGKRRPELIARDPLGIYDWRTRIVIENGVEVERLPGIDTRQGPIQTINGGLTGYALKKQLDADILGTGVNNENVKIEFRYAEILLNYAEASLGLGQTDEAATYINMIRSRSGMPDFTGDVEEALRYERRIEFTFEGLRWLDVRRWKILDTALQDAIGINIEEVTEDGVTTTTWKRAVVQQRGPVTDKMYWVPIPREEINRAPQLTQNPGY